MRGKLGQLGTIIKGWSLNPIKFVEEALGVNESVRADLKITSQQKDFLNMLGKLVNAKIKNYYKADLDEEEQDLVSKWGISVMAAMGVGKDAALAWAILWFMYCFPYPKIPCTAPVADTLRYILWSEVSKWLNHRKDDGTYACTIRDAFEVMSDTIQYTLVDKAEKGKRWFAVGRTANPKKNEDDQVETLGGFHEDFVMVVVDEATGVPEPVFKPLSGGLTGKCNFIVMIFNPTKRTGYAMESQLGDGRKNWIKLNWNAHDSELVTKQHIKNVKEKYGENSNFYRIRIMGLPPISEKGTLIPWDWVDDAVDREIKIDEEYDPIIFGVDCAGMGEDSSVIIARQGGRVLSVDTYDKLRTDELANWVLLKLSEYDSEEIGACFIDTIGIGAGVYDQVKKNFRKARAINVSESTSQKAKFQRLRDELWWKVKCLFEERLISIPNNEALIAELSSPKYGPDERGKIKVESKKKMRERGIKSPNIADALILTYAVNDAVFKHTRMNERPYERKYSWREKIPGKSHSWMVA